MDITINISMGGMYIVAAALVICVCAWAIVQITTARDDV